LAAKIFIGGDNTPKFAQQILVCYLPLLSPGGGAAELKTERNLIYTVFMILFTKRLVYTIPEYKH
jgi:hypothetical protein